MSRHDGKARMPWSVKGVSSEARDLAKSATAHEGETMGDWLSDVIRRVGAAQAAGRPVAHPHRRGAHPVLPGRRPVAQGVPGQGQGVPARIPAPTAPAAEPAAPVDSVDEAALVGLVAERIERTETRLIGLLGTLEDIVARLADRLDRVERSLDDPRPPDVAGADRLSIPGRDEYGR